MSWVTVKGVVLDEGIIEGPVQVVRTLLVETENGDRIVIAPKEKILNKLTRGTSLSLKQKKERMQK